MFETIAIIRDQATGACHWSVDFTTPCLGQCGEAPTLSDAWSRVRAAVRKAELAAAVAGAEAQLSIRGV